MLLCVTLLVLFHLDYTMFKFQCQKCINTSIKGEYSTSIVMALAYGKVPKAYDNVGHQLVFDGPRYQCLSQSLESLYIPIVTVHISLNVLPESSLPEMLNPSIDIFQDGHKEELSLSSQVSSRMSARKWRVPPIQSLYTKFCTLVAAKRIHAWIV